MTDNPITTRLSARELILTLMDSSSSASLPASYFVAAAELFEMDPGSIRVALARLVRDGSLISRGRGLYGLGSRAGTLQSLVRNWSRAETSLVPWSGDWLTVLVGHLTRSNKSQVRGNERALKLFGFAEMKPGLWVRPANLVRNLVQVRADLLALGLHDDSISAQVSAFDPANLLVPEDLWQIEQLGHRYHQHIDLLARSKARLIEEEKGALDKKATVDKEAAVRETLLVGRQVTRDILLDPFLPDALVDAAGRREMIARMIEYNDIGRTYWREFFKRHQQANTQKPAA